ncbi:hypothetical protein WJX84_000725 [Apatococcus fuscideae]|uniref:Uncharacterized protein n=1 Tax=Apatococcus fuscideae TaxID=2026836 RepID=A0AAW1TJM8_9CHLO
MTLGEWALLPLPADTLLERSGHACCAVNEWLYIFGGRKRLDPQANARFNLASQAWDYKIAATPGPPRCYHTANLVAGNIWVIGGGNMQPPDLSGPLIYEPRVERWRMPRIKAVAVPQGMLLFGGSFEGAGQPGPCYLLHIDAQRATHLLDPSPTRPCTFPTLLVS